MHLTTGSWILIVGIAVLALKRLRRPRTRRPHQPTAAARAGQAGENRATRTLQRVGLTVWPDVRIAIGHRTSQCDQIVVGAFGLGRIPVYGAMVLSNPHARFLSRPGSQPIGTPEQIATWIQGLPVGKPFDAGKRIVTQQSAHICGMFRIIDKGLLYCERIVA